MMKEKLEAELRENQEALQRGKADLQALQAEAAKAEASFQERAQVIARDAMRREGAIIVLSKTLGIPIAMAPLDVGPPPAQNHVHSGLVLPFESNGPKVQDDERSES